MGFDKVKVKQICWIILYVAVVLFVLLHVETVVSGFGLLLEIIKPFIVGGVIAFILNIPMKGIEEKLFKKWKGKGFVALKRPISLILSILFVVAVITLVIVAILPQLKATFTTLGNKLPGFFEDVEDMLAELAVTYPALGERLNDLSATEFDWNAILSAIVNFLQSGVTNMLNSTVNVASGIIGAVTTSIIGLIFSVYILLQKEKLQEQILRIISAYLPERTGGRIREICHRLHVNFTNFICGQCLEAVILGCLFVVVMSILGLPYAIMIGTLIAFTALIPIVGAFIGCAVGAFMILIDDPIKALWFVILFLILQQMEGNLIYPRVVGNSVGLPAIWVLVSVSTGGSLFGVAGMLMFIPLMSTIYSLIKDDVNSRNRRKMMSRQVGIPEEAEHAALSEIDKKSSGKTETEAFLEESAEEK